MKYYFEIQGDLKKMLTALWEYHYDIFSNNFNIFTIPTNTFLESPTDNKKKY